MKKKFIAWSLAAILAVSAIGCGSGGTSDTDKPSNDSTDTTDTTDQEAEGTETGDGALDAKGETLTVWMPPYAQADGQVSDQEFWERELKPLADETGCTVKVEIIPWGSYEEKYLTGTSSGDGPDVGYMYMEMFYDYIDQQQIVDIDSYFSDEEKANYLYYNLGNIMDGQYGLPISVGNPRVLIGNKKILEEAGITEMPTTWDEFTTDCKTIMDKTDYTPFVQAWGSTQYGSLNDMYWPFFWSNGGEIIDKDGNLTIDSDAGIEATKFIYGLKEDGILSESCTSLTDTLDNFKAGDTAFIITASTVAAGITDIDWDYVTALTSPAGDAKTFVAADSLVMFSTAKNPELAAKAMKLMTSTDVMTRFNEEISILSPITKDEKPAADDKFSELYSNDADKLVSLPVFEGSAALYDVLFKNLQSMMLGDMTPEEALKSSTEYYNSNIKE